MFVAQEPCCVHFGFAKHSRNVRDKTDYYLVSRRELKHAPKPLVFVPGGSTVIFRPSVASKCTAARGLSALAVPHDTLLQRRPRVWRQAFIAGTHGRGWCRCYFPARRYRMGLEVSNAVGRSATEAIFVLDTLRPVRRFGDLVSIAVAIGSVDVVSRVAACIQSEAVAEEFIISGRVELPGLVCRLAAACLSNCAPMHRGEV